MRFIAAGYYDLSSLYTSYIGKHKRGLIESARPEHHNVRALELLSDKEETEVLQNWSSAKALLHKVSTRLAGLPMPAELMSADILAFAPGAYTQWHKMEVPEGHGHVMALLNPSPNFRLHAGEETIVLPPWGAMIVDNRVPVSMTNFDAPNTAHLLVLETRIKSEGLHDKDM